MSELKNRIIALEALLKQEQKYTDALSLSLSVSIINLSERVSLIEKIQDFELQQIQNLNDRVKRSEFMSKLAGLN